MFLHFQQSDDVGLPVANLTNLLSLIIRIPFNYHSLKKNMAITMRLRRKKMEIANTHLYFYYFFTSKGEFRQIWLKSQRIVLWNHVGWKSFEGFLCGTHNMYTRAETKFK